MKLFKRIRFLLVCVGIVTVVSCARKGTDRTQEAADTAQEGKTAEPVEVKVDIPEANDLINKVLNLPAGEGTFTMDGRMFYHNLYADTRARGTFVKGEEVSRMEGELLLWNTYKPPGDTETTVGPVNGGEADETHAIDAYLWKRSSSGEGTEGSRYELYLFDDTDDTWEKETFKPSLVTTVRMTAKKMMTDAQVSYRAPDRTERFLTEVVVMEDDPGEFVLRTPLDAEQLLYILDGFGLGETVENAAGTAKDKATDALQQAADAIISGTEDNVIVSGVEDNVISGLDTEAIKQFLEDNKDTAKEFLESHGDEVKEFLESYGGEAKEFLESHGEDAGAYLEEHADELTQFLGEHADTVTEFLDGHGDEIKQAAGDLVEKGQQTVQAAKDYLDIRALLQAMDVNPYVTATFDALTLNVKELKVEFPKDTDGAYNIPEEADEYIARFVLEVNYTSHDAADVTLPGTVTSSAEDKEQGMIFHRIMEEFELRRKDAQAYYR